MTRRLDCSWLVRTTDSGHALVRMRREGAVLNWSVAGLGSDFSQEPTWSLEPVLASAFGQPGRSLRRYQDIRCGSWRCLRDQTWNIVLSRRTLPGRWRC